VPLLTSEHGRSAPTPEMTRDGATQRARSRSGRWLRGRGLGVGERPAANGTDHGAGAAAGFQAAVGHRGLCHGRCLSMSEGVLSTGAVVARARGREEVPGHTGSWGPELIAQVGQGGAIGWIRLKHRLHCPPGRRNGPGKSAMSKLLSVEGGGAG